LSEVKKMWFLAIPGIMYIIALVLAVLAVGFSAIILGWLQLTISKILFLGVGMYILLKFSLPALIEGKLDSKSIIFLVILALLMVGLGLPGYGLSVLGNL